MRWSSFERGNKLRLGRLAGSRQKRVYEVWVCRCDHEQCRLLNGQQFLRGRGPQPRVTTPADCQCERVPVPVRRIQRAPVRDVVRRPSLRLSRLVGQGFDVSDSTESSAELTRSLVEVSAERAGVSFAAQSCKDE